MIKRAIFPFAKASEGVGNADLLGTAPIMHITTFFSEDVVAALKLLVSHLDHLLRVVPDGDQRFTWEGIPWAGKGIVTFTTNLAIWKGAITDLVLVACNGARVFFFPTNIGKLAV